MLDIICTPFCTIAKVRGVGAEIAEIGAAHREKPAFVVERKFGFDREIARLIVAQRTTSWRSMIHFTGRPSCRAAQATSANSAIDHAAGAEIAADVLHQHTDLLGRHVKHGGEIVLQPQRAAIAGIDGVASGRGVELGERGARLHRHAGDALHPGFEPCHMGGAGKRGLGRRASPRSASKQTLERALVVHARRILPRRRAGLDDGGQHFVVDLDRFGAVLRRIHGFGDDHRDRFANETRLVGRQRIVRRRERLLAVCSRSMISAGCCDHALCGIGLRPSATKSAPVSTAITPGTALALSFAMPRMRAWACGERTITA